MGDVQQLFQDRMCPLSHQSFLSDRSTLFNVAVTVGLFGLIAYFAFGRKSGSTGGLGGNPFVSLCSSTFIFSLCII